MSNIGQTGVDNPVAPTNFARAQGFTTGTNGNGYTLESIEIHTNVTTAALTAQQIATIEAELWSSSSGKPGSKLADLTVPSSFATGARASTFSAPAGTTLAASTEYHVVVYTTVGTLSTFRLTHNGSDAEDSGAAAGWSIANASNYFRNGSAAPTASSTWTGDFRSMKIRVNGAAVPFAAPTNLTVTPGPLRLDLAWTAPSGTVTGYDVHYTTATADAVSNGAAVQTGQSARERDGWVAATRTDTDTTASHRLPGAELLSIRVRVRAKGAGGVGAWAFGSGTPTPQEPPTGLRVAAGNGQLTLTWAAPAGDLHRYELAYTSAPKTGNGAVADDAVATGTNAAIAWVATSHPAAGATSFTITGLTNNTAYRLRLRAIHQSRAESAYAFATGTPLPPGAVGALPGGLKVTAADGRLELSWTAPAGVVEAYHVDYTTSATVAADARAGNQGGDRTPQDPAVGWVALQRASGAHNDATLTSYTVRGMNLQRYRVRVRATNAVSRGPWAHGAGTPEGLLLTGLALTKAQGETGTYDALALSPGFSPRVTDYTAAVPHAVTHVKARPTVGVLGGYVLSVGKRGAAAVSLASGVTSGAIALDAGANAIEVVASSTLGQGANTTWTITVTRHAQSAPAAPGGLAVTAGDGELALAWTAPSGTVTGYDVHYTSSAVPDGAAALTGGSASAAAGWVSAGHSGTTAAQTISGLDDGTAYRVRVRAENAGVKGFWAHAAGTTERAAPTPTVALSASPVTVAEGSSVAVTARLSAALSSGVTIPLSITDGTAEPDDHGTLAEIAIAGGATSGSGTITTSHDADDVDETFTVALGTLPPEVAAGSPSSVRITIRDDDTRDPPPPPRDPPPPPPPVVFVGGGGGPSGGGSPTSDTPETEATGTRIVGRRARAIEAPYCFVPDTAELDALGESTHLAYRLDSEQDFDLCLWMPDPNWRTAPAYATCRGTGGVLPEYASLVEGAGREEFSVERALELMACIVPAEKAGEGGAASEDGSASEGGAWQLRIAPENPEPEDIEPEDTE